jgi:hypothetical protein
LKIGNDVQTNRSKRFWSLFKLKTKSNSIPQTMSAKSDYNDRVCADTPLNIANITFNRYLPPPGGYVIIWVCVCVCVCVCMCVCMSVSTITQEIPNIFIGNFLNAFPIG